MPVTYLPEEALNYKNQWVAFSADLQRVVGHGYTTSEAAEAAKEAGEENSFLLFIPEHWPDTLVL